MWANVAETALELHLLACSEKVTEDLRTRDAVVRQLDRDPGVDNSAISVATKNGEESSRRFTADGIS